MPAVAIVAAVGTVSAGAAMGGVLGGIMMAGGVMTGLGAVTGNRNLQRIGMVASLGAGIGSALGLAGAANSAWNSAVGAAADGAGSALGVTGNSFLATGGSMEAIGNAIGYNAAPTAGLVAPANTAPITSPEAFSLTGAPSQTGLVANAAPASGMGADAFSLQAGNAPGAVASINGSSGGLLATPVSNITTDALVGGAQGNGSFISNAMDFLRDKNNAAIITTGGGLISGAMQSYSAQNAADAEYERRRQTDAEARARYNASITNQPRTLFRG